MEQEEKRYPSDLTDQEWAIVESLIPVPKLGGHPRTVNIRKVVNGIFYVLRGGIPWRFLPKDFPPWQTVYYYFWIWRREGLIERMNTVLREQERVRVGQEADSQCWDNRQPVGEDHRKGGREATTGVRK